MDLNYLFSQQQLALIRAADASDAVARTRHFAAADLIGHRIRTEQLAGASGRAPSWLHRDPTLAQPSLQNQPSRHNPNPRHAQNRAGERS